MLTVRDLADVDPWLKRSKARGVKCIVSEKVGRRMELKREFSESASGEPSIPI